MIRRLRRWWRRRKAAQRRERWERAQPLTARIEHRKRLNVQLKVEAARALAEDAEDRARRIHRQRKANWKDLQDLIRMQDSLRRRRQS